MAVRNLCRTDLFFLLIRGLKRADADNDWVFDRCKEVEADPDGYVDLWAREYFKSTIITFAKTIQDILASHGEGAIASPEVTVGIFSHTRPIAKQFLRQIMQEFEINEDLKALFPDVLWANPRKEAPKWSEDDGIVVKRRGNPKEATIEAWGLVDGMPTSKHFHLRVYDDVVTERSVTTPEMIIKTTNAWSLSLNLGARGGRERYAGTRYNEFDTYHVMQSRGYPLRLYPATADGSDDLTKAVFLSPEMLADKKRRMGPEAFATQMLLNPKLAHVSTFEEDDLRWWKNARHDALTKIVLVDPASEKKKSSDYTAIWVLGLGADENWYVIDHVKDRLNLKGRVQTVMALHRKHKPVFVGYEKYGMQADIEAVQWEQERQNYRFDITPLGAGTSSGRLKKEDRIKRLQPIIAAHRLYMPEGGCVHTNYEGVAQDTIRLFITEELVPFPVLVHDDALDCLSRIEDEEVKLFVAAPNAEAPKESSFMEELIADHYQSSGGATNWLGR